MAHDGVAKVQHYVPYFLLKRWGTGKKKHLHILSKASGQARTGAADRIARQSRFYDLSVDGHVLSVEPFLSEVETAASGPVRKLIESENLGVLTPNDVVTISSFAAVQFVRTPGYREHARSISTALGAAIRAENDVSPELIADIEAAGRDDQVAALSIRAIVDAPRQLGPHFSAKRWLLMKPALGQNFLIGDHPVVLQNQTDDGSVRGNLGLAVKGIEIYLPLSPQLVLAMLCPSLLAEMSDRLIEAKVMAQAAGGSSHTLHIASAQRNRQRAINGKAPNL